MAPSEDGEEMEESRSNAVGTEDCTRVAVKPSNEYEGGGAPEAVPIEGLAEAGVPSEDGEEMERPCSGAIGTEDCMRVAVEPSVVVAEAVLPSGDGERAEDNASAAARGSSVS